MPIHLPPTSRRQFLSGLAFGGASILTAGRASAAAQGRLADEPGGYVALISDTHIAADAEKTAREQNMSANLRAAVDDILAQPEAPRAALVTGDLAFNSGEPGDYAQFLSLVRPLRERGIPVHLTMGNHDDRANFLGAIRAEDPVSSPLADRCVGVVETAGLRFVILDSLDGPGLVGGRLRDVQLAWLARTLDANADTATMVLVHHNPAYTPEQLKGCLGDTDELLDILRPRKQVKALIFGHSHVWNLGRDDGLHHINLPATAYAFAPDQPLGWCRFTPRDGGATIEPRCVAGNREVDKTRFDLSWRNA